MPGGSPDLTHNPYFQNALTLDLISWRLLSLERAAKLWVDPYLEARRVTGSEEEGVIEETVEGWRREFSQSGHRVAERWPHAIFPVLPEDFSLSD